MNYKAYKIAKACESALLLIASVVVAIFCVYLIANPKDWGIAGIFVIIFLIFGLIQSIPLFIMSLIAILRILACKYDDEKYSGYLLGAIAKIIALFYCATLISSAIKENVISLLIIVVFLSLVLLVAIFTDFKLISQKKKDKTKLKNQN